MNLRVYLIALSVLAAVSSSAAVQTNWLSWGGNLANWRYSDHCVNKAALAAGMTVKWRSPVETVYSTPSVCGGFVYALDSAGAAYKFRQNPGALPPLVWKKNLKAYVVTSGARSSFVFDQACTTMYTFTMGSPAGVHILALRTADGALVYAKVVDNHPLARATMSPTFYGGFIYVGMSSTTENSGQAPTFRGSMFKIQAANGAVIWRTFTAPPGYTGNPIWGSAPAVDVARNQVCVGTGNNYGVPAAVANCIRTRANNPLLQLACASPANYVAAVVCFDLTSGRVRWGKPMHGVNVYITGQGRDYDLAQAPILVNNLLVAASKAGAPFALRAADGGAAWKNVVKIGATAITDASSMFGSCTDGVRFIMGLYWFAGPNRKRGVVAAFNARNGQQLWVRDFGPASGGVYGPLTCTKNVVFAPLFDATGSLVALDIANGNVLGSFKSGASLFCGPAIVSGTMFLGNGYSFGAATKGTTFYAVNLPLLPAC